MSTIGLIMLAIIGTTLVAGLSIAMYAALPEAMLDAATRHGRYVGLGTREVLDDTAGNAPISDTPSLQGQSA
jgi:hypothetical protein